MSASCCARICGFAPTWISASPRRRRTTSGGWWTSGSTDCAVAGTWCWCTSRLSASQREVLHHLDEIEPGVADDGSADRPAPQVDVTPEGSEHRGCDRRVRS